MANTYTQIHIQVVFAVKYRQALIGELWKKRLYKYISGIIHNNGHKMLQINGMPDHIHILIGMRPVQALSDLIKLIKQDSSKWINQNGLVNRNFSWQQGYGAFSYSKSQLPVVINYIQNQEEHHKRITFINEYMGMLNAHSIKFDERFIFKSIL